MAERIKWNSENANGIVKKNSNGNCEFIEFSYKNNRRSIIITCANCQIPFETFPYRFINGKQSCNKCNGKVTWTIESLREFVKNRTGGELISTEYKNNNTLFEVTCRCGKNYKTTVKRIHNGKTTCESCTNERLSQKFTKPVQEFEREVYELVGDKYKVVGKYKNRKTKVLMKHLLCGYEWLVNPSDFISKESRCPKCNESKGERAIAEWLDSHDFIYEREKRFEWCRLERELPFDFIVFRKDSEILLIEYDGKQHFINDSIFGDLQEIQKRDAFKNECCKNNNIPLLRIPYTKYKNIASILENALL